MSVEFTHKLSRGKFASAFLSSHLWSTKNPFSSILLCCNDHARLLVGVERLVARHSSRKTISLRKLLCTWSTFSVYQVFLISLLYTVTNLPQSAYIYNVFANGYILVLTHICTFLYSAVLCISLLAAYRLHLSPCHIRPSKRISSLLGNCWILLQSWQCLFGFSLSSIRHFQFLPI